MECAQLLGVVAKRVGETCEGGARSFTPAQRGRHLKQLSKSELQTDRAFDRCHIFPVQAADALAQAKFADGAQLIRHCLALLASQPDIGFGRIKARHMTGQRHHLDPVEFPVCHIVANHDCGSGLADLTNERLVKRNPPDFAALRRPI